MMLWIWKRKHSTSKTEARAARKQNDTDQVIHMTSKLAPRTAIVHNLNPVQPNIRVTMLWTQPVYDDILLTK